MTSNSAAIRVSEHSLLETLRRGVDIGSFSALLAREFRLNAANREDLPLLTSTVGIPSHSEIKVSPILLDGHFLRPVIEKEGTLTELDLRTISRELGSSISAVVLGRGAIPASVNGSTHYSRNSWPRDSAMTAFALKRDGKSQEATDVLWGLLEFYGAQSQRSKFDYYHFCSDPVKEYARQAVSPHSVAHITDDGRLEEVTHGWGHEQLDTIGWLLFLSFRLANDGAVDLLKIDKRLTTEVNAFNADESFFPLAIKFLHRIQAWNQKGRGPWEDFLEKARATELGMLLSGLVEAQKFFSTQTLGWGCFATNYGQNCSNTDAALRLKSEHEELIRELRQALKRRVPDEPAAYAIECDDVNGQNLKQDSGMVWLLYPGDIGLTPNQEAAILRTVYSNMGELGFRRRPFDSYVGQDYAHESNPHIWRDFAQTKVADYREAPWTLFDPMLAAYFSRRYVESGGRDEEAFLKADRHLKRALALVTSTETKFDWYQQDTNQTVAVTVPARCLPEALWYSTRQGCWLPNHNSPLLMANSALALALLRFGYALEIRHQQFPHAA